MGNKQSLQNIEKRVIPDVLEIVVNEWRDYELNMCHKRYEEDGSKFTLPYKSVARILGCMPHYASLIFSEVLDPLIDGERKGHVFATDFLFTLILASQMSEKEKYNLAFKIFSNLITNKEGLNKEELILLLQSACRASSILNRKYEIPDNASIENLGSSAFNFILTNEGRINQKEFVDWCLNNARIRFFLELWKGEVCEIIIDKGNSLYWEDPEFPANVNSLVYDVHHIPEGFPPHSCVRWLRPWEFCPGEPKLFVDGIDGGLISGQMQHHWIANAFAILQTKKVILERLFINTGQEKNGRYCVKIFKEGKWQFVVIDDLIPCDQFGIPLFTRSFDPNTIWPLLIEKAYAKLYGCYESLTTGDICYILNDLTASSTTVYSYLEFADLKNWYQVKDENKKIKMKEGEEDYTMEDLSFWENMEEIYLKHGCLVGLVSWKNRKKEIEPHNGILKGHVYTIEKIKEVTVKPKSGKPQTFKMFLLFNPWKKTSWQGEWSKNSRIWRKYKGIVEDLDYKEELYNENYFWMNISDIKLIFDAFYTVSSRHLSPDWGVHVKGGVWNNKTCGGIKNWRKGQQFGIKVTEKGTKLHVVLSTIDYRWSTGSGIQFPIGLLILRAQWDTPTGSQKAACIKADKVLRFTRHFLHDKAISLFVDLKNEIGDFVVIPLTFESGICCNYTLLCHSSNKHVLMIGQERNWELDERYIGVDDDLKIISLGNNQNCFNINNEDDTETVGIRHVYKLISDAQNTIKDLNNKKDELLEKLSDIYRKNKK